MFCTVCGNNNPDGAAVCTKCGNALPGFGAQQPAQGQPYAPPAPPQQPAYTPPPQNQYVPPQQNQPAYAPPQQNQYAPPPQNTYTPPVQQQPAYVPPQQNQYAPPPQNQPAYAPPPPPPAYKPPVQQQPAYTPPAQPAPPQNQPAYTPPQQNQYAPPPQNQYAPPPPQSAYKPPVQQPPAYTPPGQQQPSQPQAYTPKPAFAPPTQAQPSAGQPQQYGGFVQTEYAPEPAKKKKTGLIITLSAAGVVVIAFLIILFTVILPGQSDEGQVKSIIKAFESATNSGSLDPIRQYLPPDMSKAEIAGLESGLASMKSEMGAQYNVSISYGKIEFNEDKTSARVEAVMNIHMTFMGQNYDETEEETMYFQKIDGKWYVSEDTF